MQKGQYRIILTRHAFLQAMKRGIHPDIIESALQQGTMQWFGKNRVKFVKQFRDNAIICVDEVRGDVIVIVTIVKKVKK